MAYVAKDYSKLVGLVGLSDAMLANHVTLYQWYVNNTNKVLDTLSSMLKDDQSGTPQYAELKRRVGWEFNGMRLHEYYFENLGGKTALKPDSKLAKYITANFGSYDTWLQDFKGTATMRGIGWTILYHDSLGGKLFNQWINEHETGHFAGCTPVLIMDVFEHAFMIDYGLKRADYIAAFFKNINWDILEKRVK